MLKKTSGSMALPQRIQLSRRKGFLLARESLASNGLPAVNVSRPGYFGNPFRVGVNGTAAECVAKFEEALLAGALKHYPFPDRPRVGWKLLLRGKNLACWCKPGSPCHADVLLRIANR